VIGDARTISQERLCEIPQNLGTGDAGRVIYAGWGNPYDGPFRFTSSEHKHGADGGCVATIVFWIGTVLSAAVVMV